jgi:hypothetical protein
MGYQKVLLQLENASVSLCTILKITQIGDDCGGYSSHISYGNYRVHATAPPSLVMAASENTCYGKAQSHLHCYVTYTNHRVPRYVKNMS